ncbi:unnamed protein product [Gongylonema pulchrum]|uniref:BPTI/Kunitz inhibitor domain-containing protein n=1 Tax=Gongylonema pulchrum TaxID=637853 RepID=A0A3P7NR35_9BILA|nr:unnamed protein product [Gongylonema pulchrum]
MPNPCSEGKPLMNAQNEPTICGGSENCPNDYYCHIANDACTLPVEEGKGTERLDRWYFDSSEHVCRKFVYRGLQGNANNFISREACQQSCKGYFFSN